MAANVAFTARHELRILAQCAHIDGSEVSVYVSGDSEVPFAGTVKCAGDAVLLLESHDSDEYPSIFAIAWNEIQAIKLPSSCVTPEVLEFLGANKPIVMPARIESNPPEVREARPEPESRGVVKKIWS